MILQGAPEHALQCLFNRGREFAGIVKRALLHDLFSPSSEFHHVTAHDEYGRKRAVHSAFGFGVMKAIRIGFTLGCALTTLQISCVDSIGYTTRVTLLFPSIPVSTTTRHHGAKTSSTRINSVPAPTRITTS